MYELICISADGEESVTEHNIFSDDGTFSTVEDAWERNENMGSRWFFYPIRIVVEKESDRIASGGCAGEIHESWEGFEKKALMTAILLGEMAV